MKKICIATHHDEHADHSFGIGIMAGYHTFGPFLETHTLPFILPAGLLTQEQIVSYVSMSDIVVLMGGDDVDPILYGENVQFDTVQRYQTRDQNEILLVKETIKQNKPLIGICRGMQLINVALGGTLFQHIGSQVGGDILHFQSKNDYKKLAHTVSITKDSFLYDIYQQDTLLINSFHNQAVKQLAPGLKAVAHSNVIEAFCHTNYPIYGIQRHPERSYFFDTQSEKLIKRFGSL